jgi:hypothetical protein
MIDGLPPQPLAVSTREVTSILRQCIEFDYRNQIIYVLNQTGLAALYEDLKQRPILDCSVKDIRDRIGNLLIHVDTDTEVGWGSFYNVRSRASV